MTIAHRSAGLMALPYLRGVELLDCDGQVLGACEGDVHLTLRFDAFIKAVLQMLLLLRG